MKKIILLLTIFTLNSKALRLSPMVGYLEPSGKKSVFNFTAINTTKSPEALKVSIEYRNEKDILKFGKSAESLFEIYPKKAILFPKDSGKINKKDIKVIWKGGDVQNLEKSFRLVVEQVPLNFSKKKFSGGKMQIVSRYIASVYVAPEEFKSEPKVLSTKIEGNYIHIDIENSGNKHHLCLDPYVKISFGGNEKRLNQNELKGLYLYSVLAKTKRTLKVEIPFEFRGKALKAENIKVSI